MDLAEDAAPVAPGGAALQPVSHATDAPLGGPAGSVMDVLVCLAPVAFLLVVTLSKRLVRSGRRMGPLLSMCAALSGAGFALGLFMPTSRSLPYAAALLWLIKMAFIGEDPIHITATVLQGGLLGLVPLSILFGAFLFFNVLILTQTMPYAAALVRATCCNHPVAEVFLVLWALGHLIEGASGFGTGPAMLPPIMAALGHPPFESVVCLLIMTSCVGPFGSSGIGLWFGLSALDWSRAQLVRVTFLVAVCMTVMSFPVAGLASRLLLSWEDLRGCWLFVVLSVTACALPALLAALFSFEAPGLLSGVLGVVFTGLLARNQLGLSQEVPCAVARQQRDMEAGAAAAVSEPAKKQDPATGWQAAQHEAGDDAPKRAKSARPVLASRGVFEVTAAAASYPAASQQRHWGQQEGLELQPGVQRHSTEGRTGAAQGLLKALAATSTSTAPLPQASGATQDGRRDSAGWRDSTDSSPSSAEGSADGGEELLLAQAVRSHQDLAAYHSTVPAAGPSSRSGDGVRPGTQGTKRQLPGSSVAAAPATCANPTVDATSAYLSDRHQLALRLLPWAAMLVVVAGTRIPYLQKTNGHELRLHLRSLGDFTVSSNLVLQFRDLCRIGVNWSYALLYVPSFLPFICTGCATLAAFRHSIPAEKSWRDPFAAAATKCKSVSAAIVGALILVALMVQGGRQAPSYIIGYWLSEWLQKGYIAVSMLLGGVGSFFSGSVATSNMTFGLLQQVAAVKLGLNATAMVMLQIVGGAAGQMISISNILGGRAVMGLQHIPEGQFVKAALPACLAYYVVGTALALPFLFS